MAVLSPHGMPVGLGSARLRADGGRAVTIGYSILPTFWGRGLGTELAARLVEFSFASLAGREVRATTVHDNPASGRVLEKLGFVVSEAEATEPDSRGEQRHVTRWRLADPAAFTPPWCPR